MRYELQRFTAPLAVAAVVATLVYAGSLVLGKATMAVIGGSAVIAYFVWLATAWRRPIDPALVTLPYIVLVAMELIHMAEEQLTNFPGSLAGIFHIPASFDLVMHAMLLMGAVNAAALLAVIAIRSSNVAVRQIGGYIMWFYVIGPGMVNAVAHATFPFLAHSWYFSGLITVALPTAAGLYTLKRLLQSDEQARRLGVSNLRQMIIDVQRVRSSAEFERFGRLLSAYEESLPPELRHSGLAQELSNLPHFYAAPHAAFVSTVDGEIAGSVALTRLDGSTGILKRLYVLPQFRKHGIGRRLVQACIDAARSDACSRIVLDTDKTRMPAAYALYRSLGFHESAPYGPVEYACPTFMELVIASADRTTR